MNNTFTYESIDLCTCYNPVFLPPLDFQEACRKYWERHSPFTRTVERRIGNTWYSIKTECAGTELLADKIKRLIFSDNGRLN